MRGHWDFQFCGFCQFLVRFFGFSTLKLWVFGFGILCILRVSFSLVLGFGQQLRRFFHIFLASAFYSFSGFAKEVTPCSPAKSVLPSDH